MCLGRERLRTPKNHSFAHKPTTVLTFNEYGLLLPAEGISVNTDELYDAFVRPFGESDTRARLFHDWTKYNRMLRQEIGVDFTQWVDGSFVTQKLNPKDIDSVSFIPSYLFRKFESRLDYYWTDNWEREGIDAYLVEVFREEEPQYDLTKLRTSEWYERYTNTKRIGLQPGRPKGFLMVNVI